MTNTPTVYVAEDDPAVRDYLRELLKSVNLPVEVFESGRHFLEQYTPEATGCLVTDLRMPGLSGLELQSRLLQRGANLPIIFITAHGEVDSAVRALKAGAEDFLEKPIRGQELIDSVQNALASDTKKRSLRSKHRETTERLKTLNPGERAVLDLMVEGNPYKAIAIKLNLSYKTVEARRARIMKKLGTQNLSELFQLMISYAHLSQMQPAN